MSFHSPEDVCAEIASLAYDELKARYQQTFRRPPPPRLGRDLLRRALTYKVQADRYGGLSTSVEKLLRKDSSRRTQTWSGSLTPGTQLVREWQGQLHIVEILELGFRWNDKKFESLSAVARQITGTRWSGPRFFGLVREKRK